MTTQSKSVLIPFLVIAGIVFAVALAWKFLGNHDTESPVKPAEIKISEPVETKKVVTTTTVPETIEYNETQPAFLEPTTEDREKLKKQAQSNMKFAMRYPTLETAISALEAFRDNGNDQAASDMINYIRTSFPNDTIPSNLLD